MSQDILLILALVAVLVVICQLALAAWNVNRIHRFRAITRTERIRLQIGDARCRLMNLVARGELSPSSVTFQRLYVIQTTLVRGTHLYPALSEALWARVLRFEKRGQSALAKEAKNWSPEVQQIADQTADAVRKIWILYMPGATVLRLAKQIGIALGIMTYDSVERFCDVIMQWMVRAADRTARVLTTASFRWISKDVVGGEVRLVHDMRESERILRGALARAPKAS